MKKLTGTAVKITVSMPGHELQLQSIFLNTIPSSSLQINNNKYRIGTIFKMLRRREIIQIQIENRGRQLLFGLMELH